MFDMIIVYLIQKLNTKFAVTIFVRDTCCTLVLILTSSAHEKIRKLCVFAKERKKENHHIWPPTKLPIKKPPSFIVSTTCTHSVSMISRLEHVGII